MQQARSLPLIIRKEWFEEYTGLFSVSNQSTESLNSEDGAEGSEDTSINYAEFQSKIPDLQTHLGGHEQIGEWQSNCPWCDHQYFKWLLQHDKVSFISEVPTGELLVQEVATTAGQVEVGGPEVMDDPTIKFQFFETSYLMKRRKGASDAYFEKKSNKRKKAVKPIVEDILSKSVVQTAASLNQNQFAKLPQSQEAVRDWVEVNCPYLHGLQPYSIDNNLFLLPSPHFPALEDVPKYLFMRFDKTIHPMTMTKLWNLWCKMRASVKTSERRKNRDSQAQVHWGVWGHYSQVPRVTSDTKNQPESIHEDVIAFTSIFRFEIVKKVWGLLMRYDPVTLRRHVKARDSLRTRSDFMELMREFSHVDFGGMFYTIAVKEGGSQTVHLDWMDHRGTYSWVILIGPGWEGGDLCFPQLGKRIPTKPGQIIAFRGRYLAHFAAPHAGERLVITGFTDRTLMGQALEMECVVHLNGKEPTESESDG